MSDNLRVLLVGPGNMGKEYCKVLLAQGRQPIVIGRGPGKAKIFEEATGIPVMTGGVETAIKALAEVPDYAIVASTVADLPKSTISVIEAGVKNVLVEKPAGINSLEIKAITEVAHQYGAKVYVAYNRRFYASVEKLLQIVQDDGGVSSFNFEFTEWSDRCRTAVANYDDEHREAWFMANSTHVVDLAFFIGGNPVDFISYVQGGLDWHKSGCVYAGAGRTDKGALFSYQANWAAPGRWGVEILTPKHRLYLRPMEKLSIQNINSIAVDSVDINDEIDLKFKPGLYNQVKAFLEDQTDARLCSIEDHLKHMQTYAKMEAK